ncbi:TonB-dependent receptor [Dasania marina]|uniref:TonB-dependent receptor n=1 Tax=Dasania marina TaxID=471499 RepID=UPI00035ED54A|nr:TonB-dependent receptor [Dasania marina]
MKTLCKSLLALSISATAHANTSIETVVVSSDFRDTTLQQAPVSASVFSAELIQQRHAQHLEQLLAMAPNVNFASGSSRARYFQIRGIGERSQFIEPINPSVGVIIDGVDFTGIGTVGTLFDVEQVEILRGPQGTRYGANALAGMIAIQSQAPSETLNGYIEATVAEYDTYSLGAAVGGPISDELLYRVAVQQHQSDGYMDNVYLNKKDTNNFDELTARAKLRWIASSDLSIDVSLFRADIDNGYDVFTFDNSRNSIADQPGHDKQETNAIAINADWVISSALKSEIIASYSNSDIEYGYDEDWSYVGLCDGTPCAGWEYSSFDNYLRDRDSGSLEFRLLSGETGKIFNNSTEWLLGVYVRDQSETLDRAYTYLSSNFTSDFDTTSQAIFAETATALTQQLTLTVGLRVEDWQAEYKDVYALDIDSDETLYGGRVVMDYAYSDNAMVYASIARGYKAGGVNTDGTLTAQDRDFDTEYQWAYELGAKHSLLNNRLQTRLALFYTERKDQQVKASFSAPRNDGSTEFTDFIANAGEGNNYGLEFEAVYQATEQLQLSTALGWLETNIEDDTLSVSGRDQAHAPNYQYSVAAQYEITNALSIRVEAEGKDAFYFSDSHNARSGNYDLINARLNYAVDSWSLSLWARNLTDEDYAVRGFSGFGNDPQNFYASDTYTQLSEPRIIGVSGRYNF